MFDGFDVVTSVGVVGRKRVALAQQHCSSLGFAVDEQRRDTPEDQAELDAKSADPVRLVDALEKVGERRPEITVRAARSPATAAAVLDSPGLVSCVASRASARARSGAESPSSERRD